jgi:pyrroline-5-carboxylate reductase
MIDMATALSATGPTYTFLVMEALIDAGVHLGFSRHIAQELVHQTMLGSVLFARQSAKHPAELRNMVTSPGGTSAEAIYQMEKGTLRTVFSKAVWAAYRRAVTLGRKVDE